MLTAAQKTSDSVAAAYDGVQVASAGVKAASDGLKAIGEEMKTSNEHLRSELLAAIQKSNREFNSHIDQMVQRMRDQAVTLDTALQHASFEKRMGAPQILARSCSLTEW